ncbi:MAG: A/G-specific adenine glycosylase [Anaerolineales bacterium]|nr:A/G-specific adenine glycosylase [Chloroflexota bacterium]MBL6982202.1 A/G-specific adenine glycosylase [Anaerolineales bacterium]
MTLLLAKNHMFVNKLLNWYTENARDMPWRDNPDAYAVWVSEIMLQQTRVETVIPYYERWMQQFPDIQTLAEASQQDVLNLWEGLGYYSRARNFHKAAQIVVEQHNGQLPADLFALKSLPGIGAYTAAAIASIVFGLDEATLDGNIRRVLARLFDVEQPLGTAEAERRLWDLARKNLPSGQAADYNQALMGLGATLCSPRNPKCELCPVNENCQAFKLGIQEQRPVRKKKAQVPHHTVTAAVIQRNGKILIAQRPEGGLLGGMWEFPGGKTKPGESLHTCLEREICEELGVEITIGEPFGVYEHAYTHFRITLHAFCSTILSGTPQPLDHTDLRWVRSVEFNQYPMGKIDRQIANKLKG